VIRRFELDLPGGAVVFEGSWSLESIGGGSQDQRRGDFSLAIPVATGGKVPHAEAVSARMSEAVGELAREIAENIR
jgi:hypothetical protein